MADTWYERQCASFDAAADGKSHLASEWDSNTWSPDCLSESQRNIMLDDFRSFARLLDLPSTTEIRFATDEDVDTACASFRVCGNGLYEHPLILVNPQLFEKCSPESIVDVATGVFLHECGHILYTRQFYEPVDATNHNPLVTFLKNLVEDARIEDLIIESAPGWAPFIFAARTQLLIDEWFTPAIAKWDQTCDTDKVMLIIAAFVRVPAVLRDAPEFVRTWCDLGGRNIFEACKQIMPDVLTSELDVADAACEFYYLLRAYANQGIALLSSVPLESVSMDHRERLANQIDADAYDALRQSQKSNDRSNRPRVGSLDDLRGLIERLTKVTAESNGKTNSSGSVGRSQSESLAVRKVFSMTKSPLHLRDSKVEMRIAEARSNDSVYMEAKRNVDMHCRRLKSVFDAAKCPGRRRSGLRSTGRLDLKHLWRSSFDDKIFNLPVKSAKPKTLLALLLDASGSMGSQRAYLRALETAVLLNEAFVGHPQIELRVFAHSTSDSSCVVIDYGDSKKARKTLSSYAPMEANFDHLALHAVVERLAGGRSLYANKILVSISDGAPCNHDFISGVDATKQAVNDIRQMGWTVMGVDVGENFGEAIYGTRWHLNVITSTELSAKLTDMIAQLLRRALTK